MMNCVRECRPSVMRGLQLVVCTTLALSASPGRADTIYLKNGAFIDGMVGFRSDTFLELEIGKIGKLHIPLDDIFVIEKNKRTGAKLVEAYVDPEGEKEVLSTGKGAVGSGGEADDSDDENEIDDEDDSESPRETPRSQSDDDGHDGSGEINVLSQLVDDEELDPKLESRIKGLVKDLERQKPRYRVRAERHLKSIGRPSIPFLIPVAKSENDLTRIAVMRLFLSFGDDRVVESCIEALTDVNEYVRDYANKTLERVTGEDFGFLPYASPRKRELVQRKWARWWKKELADLAENYRSSRGDK